MKRRDRASMGLQKKVCESKLQEKQVGLHLVDERDNMLMEKYNNGTTN
jgi:hypothetical protein